MMILEGIGLLVDDMGKMIRFYRDVMGFEITEPENAVNVYLKKDGGVPEGRRSHLRGAGRTRAFPVRRGQGKGMGRLPDARELVGDRAVFGDVLTNSALSG